MARTRDDKGLTGALPEREEAPKMIRYTYEVWNATDPKNTYPFGQWVGWSDRPGSIGEARRKADEWFTYARKEWPLERFRLTLQKHNRGAQRIL